MENDRLSTYLIARLRVMTYGSDGGFDDEAVHPRPVNHAATAATRTTVAHRRLLGASSPSG
jgi:hypothetical protein